MVFVTGGTGLVGSHIIFDLLKQGQPIRALYRTSFFNERLAHLLALYNLTESAWNNIEWVKGDLSNPLLLEDYLDGVTTVYHCAAMVSFDPADKYTLFDVNIDGTAHLVNACLAAGVSKLAYVSSTAAIGKGTGKVTVTEQTPWTENKATSGYSLSKHYAEREVWRGMEEGLDVVMVNPSVIIGPGDWNKSSAKLIQTVANGLTYYTTGSNAFVDVRDVSKILIDLVNTGVSGERFLVVSENAPYRTVINQIASSLGVKPPHQKVSPWLTELVWRLEWMRSKLTGKKPFITKETAASARQDVTYSNQKITDLGYSFIPVSQSVADTAACYLSQQH